MKQSFILVIFIFLLKTSFCASASSELPLVYSEFNIACSNYSTQVTSACYHSIYYFIDEDRSRDSYEFIKRSCRITPRMNDCNKTSIFKGDKEAINKFFLNKIKNSCASFEVQKYNLIENIGKFLTIPVNLFEMWSEAGMEEFCQGNAMESYDDLVLYAEEKTILGTFDETKQFLRLLNKIFY